MGGWGLDDQARELRSRQASTGGDVDRGVSPPSSPHDSFVGSTAAIGTYPTVAASWYGIQALNVFGDETEGTAAVLASTGYPMSRAYNLGTSVPPAGTKVLVRREPGGRLVFRY